MRAVALIGLVAVVGCVTPQVRPVDVLSSQARLPFLVDGRTTREEVLLTLGIPSEQFEGERILTYLLRRDAKSGELRVIPREVILHSDEPRWLGMSASLCSLVLVFGPNHILERHSIVCGDTPVQ